MRIKHITPPVFYLALVSFTAKLWNGGNEDEAISILEDLAFNRLGWEYENYSGCAAETNADYKYAFDKVSERRAFVKALEKHLSKEIRMVTIMDVTAD